MSMVINTNVASISAQRQISTAVRDQSEAMERLSSGKRINSARDDAAGLGISNRMTSQIRGLDQAVRNANDGISLIQTAEGALDQTTNILQRMRELSIQSANGTYNDSENRASLDAEFKQLLDEIDRIAGTTQFNGQNILDGNLDEVSLQIGADAYQTVDFGIDAMDTKNLGMGSTSVDVIGSEINMTAVSTATSIGFNDISINGQSIVLAGGDPITVDTSKDELVNAINENVNGVTASLLATAEVNLTGDGNISGTDEISVTLTNADDTSQTFTIRDANNLDEVVDQLNQAGGGSFSSSLGDNGKLIITAEGASSIVVGDATNALDGASTATSVNARLALSSDNGDPVTIERGTTGTYNDLLALGFQETTTAGTIEGAGITAASTVWGVGDVSINGVSIDEASIAGTAGSLLTKVDAINAISDQTGVRAETYVTAELGNITFTAQSDKIEINGVVISGGSSLSNLAAAINEESSSTGITATVSGQVIQLQGNTASMTLGYATSATGPTLSAATLVTIQGTTGAVSGFSATSSTFAATGASTTVYGGLKMTSESGNPISIELGTAGSAEEHGLSEANSIGGGAGGTSISKLSVDSATNAQKAIDVIDNALNTVNGQRGDLGAVNNRLEFTVDNLQSVSQQTSAARSRILDADFAKESASLSRAQVLQQAGTAMLAQANSAPQQVLSILR